MLFYANEKNVSNIEVDSFAIKDIKDNLNTIMYYARAYKISPKAIMGIITTERSLHKGPANQFEEYYVRKVFLEKSDAYLENLAVATKSNVENKKIAGESDKEFKFRLENGLIWTIGLCQVSIMKSIQIDSVISLSANRSRRTVKENITCLMTPSCNIEYCAVELKNISDSFKIKSGLDISNEVGILCTLYNTGKVSESVRKYNNTKAYPVANSFGKYAEDKSKLFDQIISDAKIDQVVAAVPR